MKRKFGMMIALMTVCLAILSMVACQNESESDESALRGTFTYSEIINQGLYITHLQPDEVENNDRQYLFSNVYPINSGSEGTAIAYSIDQRLRLKKDYTYSYNYTILISNPGDWGASSAKLVVNITGTFEYVASADENEYSVLLSNPSGGTQELYGSTFSSSNIYGWSMHSQPDLELDYSLLSKLDNYEYDEYVCSRVVAVNKSTKVLTDDVFYSEILNYIAMYSNY